MALPDWPRAYGEPPIAAILRTEPSDFFVEEQLGFKPSGSGEHLWLWIEKEDINTADVAQRLARFTGLREHDIHYSGLKDKRARARQWFCIHLLKREIDWSEWSDPAVRLLRLVRHDRKLRRGTHRSNRFEIVLRNVCGDESALMQRAELIAKQGVPNYFGEQRFGRDGRNIELALRARAQPTRRPSRQQASLYLSAARSFLFNEALAERIRRANWQTPLSGEVFMLDRSNSVFKHEAMAELLPRLEAGEIHLSGPLGGAPGDVMPSAEVAQLEAECLQRHDNLTALLSDARIDSARRSLRVIPAHWSHARIDASTWRFCFELPKGCFATSVMRELAHYSLPDLFQKDAGVEP